VQILILLVSGRHDAPPSFLGIAEYAESDVDLAFAEQRLPILRIVDACVAELMRTRCHPDAECLGETLQ
jgi:hypothetical protein